MKFEYENPVTFSELKKVFWWCHVRAKFFWIALLVLTGLLVGCFIIYNSGVSRSVSYALDFVFLLIVLGIWALLSIPKFFAAKRLSDLNCNDYLFFIVDHEGFTTETDLYSSTIRWKSVKRIRETMDYIILYSQNNRPFMLFKKKMPTEVLEELMAILRDVPGNN